MISLKVIARLLDYPEQALFDHQQALIEALEPASELDLHHSALLILFIRRLCARPLLDAQADYCELFDRGRATSLLLFEHVHGESRDRGQAMVDLMAQYRAAGLEIDSRELPDFLPLYLEYLASRSAAQAREGLQDIAPILALLGARLQQREIRLASIIEGDDLTIDDRLVRGDPVGRIQEGTEVAGRILSSTRPDPRPPAVDDRLDPEAVPLDLERPVRVVERRGDEGRQHGRDERRHRGSAGE